MISIQTGDIDIGELIRKAKQPGTGALVLFDGIVRDDNIRKMELEAYRDVALAELEKIAKDATAKFGLLSVDIVHRVGLLRVGDNILVILVGAGHRKEAYEGSRYIIEAIKAGVPIWKKEIRTDGSSWVEGDRG
ncbi:MAG TPA: molybdenum cofactor biosynthesis protein MoaE [Methanomicrobiales archaeon]|nr:molybdenum cofactor biosynthesis protein MoaE [Methanomicrobiales archaeon]